ncbi:hypothetical protein Q5P01_018583 [Channa striata]|uniref:Apolipoprotein Eb n=1 Tax=Channa striata TaxID=64152 RepID=A0AA88M840_CHASR|nr:hypothetical protein Q5P01_018583 [Channa striata]
MNTDTDFGSSFTEQMQAELGQEVSWASDLEDFTETSNSLVNINALCAGVNPPDPGTHVEVPGFWSSLGLICSRMQGTRGPVGCPDAEEPGVSQTSQIRITEVSSFLVIMRVFAVIFALAVFSGCHARSLPQDSWDTAWEATVEKFKDYLTELNSRADGILGDIRSHQISRELDTLIQDSMSELTMYKDDLQTKLAPYTQEAADRLGADMQQMGDKLRTHMAEAREQAEKYGQELQTMMEQNADDVRTRVSTYTRKMKKRLNKDTQEIKRHVSEYFDELHSRTSGNVGDMKTRFDPYLAQVRDNAQAKITTLNDLLKSQVESMKDTIQTTAEDIKERFEQTAENLRSNVGSTWRSCASGFSPSCPCSVKAREPLTNILDCLCICPLLFETEMS